jgi:nucleoside-diphosphate-sugar epimerase
MARVFVTGANGFIGSHLVSALLERGHEVTGLVRATSDVRPLAHLFPRYGIRFRLVVGDIRRPDGLESALQGVEYVYHLAAVLSGTTRAEFFDSNVEGTRRLLEVVQRTRTDAFRRFFFTSSLAAAGPSPDGKPIDESAPRRPVSWYGESKRDAEDVVNGFGKAGLPVTIARPSGVYGEGERLLAEGTFPLVDTGLRPKVGFASRMVSFIYIGDLVPGIIAAAESPATVGKTYFFSDPSPYREREVMTAIADGLGTSIRVPVLTPVFMLGLAAFSAEWVHAFTRGLPLPTRDKVRELRHRWWICSPEAAKRDVGWQASVRLAEGMRRATRDWRERRERDNAGHEPLRDRLRKVIAITAGLGLIESTLDVCAGGMQWDGLARLLGIPGTIPWWGVYLLVTFLVVVFIGGASLLTLRRGVVLRFLSGAAVGIGLELANQLWLGFWQWNPETFGRLSAPWVISFVLGAGAGFGPLITNAIVQATYDKRLRIG